MGVFDWFQRADAAPPALPGPAATVPDGDWLARLDSIVNVLTGLGGATDKGRAARPGLVEADLTLEELDILYEHNGFARRIVDIRADDCTRKGWRISGEGADVLKDEERRLDVWQRIGDGMRWGGLHGGALVVMVTEDEIPPAFRLNPGAWLAEPLDLTRVRRVLSLVDLDAHEFWVDQYETDARSRRFRGARTWRISPTQAVGGADGVGGIVHASRCLYFPGALVSPRRRYLRGGIDASILQPIWTQLRNVDQVGAAGATLAQELKQNVLKIDGLKGKQVSEQASAFQLRMKVLAQSLGLLNMVILGEGEDFQTRASTITGYGDLDMRAKQSLCAVSAQPAAKLLGDAPGGLNTDGASQQGNWSAVVAGTQQSDMLDELRWLYAVLYAQKEGPTRGKAPKSWDIEFNPLDELTEAQTAALRKVYAETDQIYLTEGALTPEHVAKSRFGEKGWQSEILPVETAEDKTFEQAEAARAMLEADESGAASAADPEADAAATLNELSLTLERLVRAGDPAMVNIVRKKMAALLGTPYPGDIEVPSLDEAAAPVSTAPGGFGAPFEIPKADATDGVCWLGVPLSEAVRPMWAAARAAVEAVVGPLGDPGDAPHTTVLWMGAVDPAALPEVQAIASDVAARMQPSDVHAERIAVFPPDPDGRRAVVLELSAWGLERLHGLLLQGLAHLVTAKQHPRYRAHTTIGYTGPLTPQQEAALLELQIVPLAWTAARLEVRYGGMAVAVLPLSGRRDGKPDAPAPTV